MEEALLARLRAAAPLAELVGDRVDWFDRPVLDDDHPGATLPAIVLTLADAGREWTHSGPDNLDEPRVRFECWAERKDTVTAVKRALLAEMEQPRIVGGIRFHEAALEFERGDTEEAGSGVLFRVIQDFTFFWEEA